MCCWTWSQYRFFLFSFFFHINQLNHSDRTGSRLPWNNFPFRMAFNMLLITATIIDYSSQFFFFFLCFNALLSNYLSQLHSRFLFDVDVILRSNCAFFAGGNLWFFDGLTCEVRPEGSPAGYQVVYKQKRLFLFLNILKYF